MFQPLCTGPRTRSSTAYLRCAVLRVAPQCAGLADGGLRLTSRQKAGACSYCSSIPAVLILFFCLTALYIHVDAIRGAMLSMASCARLGADVLAAANAASVLAAAVADDADVELSTSADEHACKVRLQLH